MSNYLSRLATRASSPAQAVQPRLASRFESLTGAGILANSALLPVQMKATPSGAISVEDASPTEFISDNLLLADETTAFADHSVSVVDSLPPSLESALPVPPSISANISTDSSVSSPTSIASSVASTDSFPIDPNVQSLAASPHASLQVPGLNTSALDDFAQSTQYFSAGLRPDTDSASSVPEIVPAIDEGLNSGLEALSRINDSIAQPELPASTAISQPNTDSLLKSSRDLSVASFGILNAPILPSAVVTATDLAETFAGSISPAIATSNLSRQIRSDGILKVSNRLTEEGSPPQSTMADSIKHTASVSRYALASTSEVLPLEIPMLSPVTTRFNLSDQPSPALASIRTQVQHLADLTNAIAPVEPAQSEPNTTPPQVNVSIGRIEVRMTPPPRQPNQSHRRISQPSVTSLSDYLRQGGQR